VAFKDSLDAIPTTGRSHSCRICQLIDEWPDDEADALAVGVTALDYLDIDQLRCGHVVRTVQIKPVKRRRAA
jgi:hypothetical protein